MSAYLILFACENLSLCVWKLAFPILIEKDTSTHSLTHSGLYFNGGWLDFERMFVQLHLGSDQTIKQPSGGK